jgi:peptide/nickel transport system substrate-binding protein
VRVIAALAFAAFACGGAAAQDAKQLRFCIRADPKTLDPLAASEEVSETIRYLTGGVLIRLNRATLQLEPELAERWAVRDGGRRIDFVLRKGVRFSDGTPLEAADVAATIRRLNDPQLRSGLAESFRTGPGEIRTEANGADRISVLFPAPMAAVETLFDQLAITSRRSEQWNQQVLGPFQVAEHKHGQYVLLKRNPQYWKTDSSGRKLPYVGSIRLDVQPNRDVELLRFRRGEIHFIDKLEPEAFLRLRSQMASAAIDAGPSLDSEVLWFNQVPDAPIPASRRAWFRSLRFRRAVNIAIARDDIVRLVYRGYALPATGHISPSNKLWANSALLAPRYNPLEALTLLQQDGFRKRDATLLDPAGSPVEFSIITNAGSKTRMQMATMIQQDLKKIGIQVNIVPLEFGSLVERITQTNLYEACLLGFTNMEAEPTTQLNVWVSSGTLHAWNPGQKSPATPWESEIDRLMRSQAGEPQRRRKVAVDRVQQIMAEHVPIIYLVHPKVLVAVSPQVANVAASPVVPHLYWNIEYLDLQAK